MSQEWGRSQERENEIKVEMNFRINEKFDEAFTGDLLIIH